MKAGFVNSWRSLPMKFAVQAQGEHFACVCRTKRKFLVLRALMELLEEFNDSGDLEFLGRRDRDVIGKIKRFATEQAESQDRLEQEETVLPSIDRGAAGLLPSRVASMSLDQFVEDRARRCSARKAAARQHATGCASADACEVDAIGSDSSDEDSGSDCDQTEEVAAGLSLSSSSIPSLAPLCPPQTRRSFSDPFAASTQTRDVSCHTFGFVSASPPAAQRSSSDPTSPARMMRIYEAGADTRRRVARRRSGRPITTCAKAGCQPKENNISVDVNHQGVVTVWRHHYGTL